MGIPTATMDGTSGAAERAGAPRCPPPAAQVRAGLLGGLRSGSGGDGWSGNPSGRALIGTRGAGSAGRGGAARGVPDKCGGERRAERCGAPARTARSGGALPFSAIPASLRGAPLCGRCRGGSGWGASGGPFPRFGVSSRLS